MVKRMRDSDELPAGKAVRLEDIPADDTPTQETAAAIPNLVPPVPVKAEQKAPVADSAEDEEEEFDPEEEDGDALDALEADDGTVNFQTVVDRFARTMKARAARMSVSDIAELARHVGIIYELQAQMTRNINCATNKRQKIANTGTTFLTDLRHMTARQ
jgi:hypothetical protein